jgi:hypothetical protein
MPPIYEDLRPTLRPWQRPQPVFRNAKGQYLPGVCGNKKGRPTKRRLEARLAAYGAASDDYERIRCATYKGITGVELARVATATFGPFWKAELARQLMVSHQTVRRWAKGKRKMSLDNERLMLLLLWKRARHTHGLARYMHRRAEAAHRAKQTLAEMPRYKRLIRPGERRTVF